MNWIRWPLTQHNCLVRNKTKNLEVIIQKKKKKKKKKKHV